MLKYYSFMPFSDLESSHFTDSAFTCVRKNSLSMASHDHEVALTQLFTSIHSSTHFITKKLLKAGKSSACTTIHPSSMAKHSLSINIAVIKSLWHNSLHIFKSKNFSKCYWLAEFCNIDNADGIECLICIKWERNYYKTERNKI